MKHTPMVLAAGIALLLTFAPQPVSAETIVIEGSKCAQLKPGDLEKVQKKLRDSKAIGPKDTIQCKAPDKTAVTERNLSFGSIFSWISGRACEEKNLAALEKCAEMDGAAADKCRADENARYEAVKSQCK